MPLVSHAEDRRVGMRRTASIVAVMGLAGAVLALPSLVSPASAGTVKASVASPVPAVTATITLSNRSARTLATPATTLRTVFTSGDVAVNAATVLGISWAGAVQAGTRVEVSAREAGAWGSAYELGVEGDTRDGRTAVEPLVAHAATAVRVTIRNTSGIAPTDVQLVAINSPASSADSQPAAITRSVAAPSIITRAQWGADETRRTGTPAYSATLKVGVLHHTLGWTTYTQAEAYQFIRALYDWYTTPTAKGGPGYSDIVWNAMVDRYGRVFEGRAGGMDKAVVGDHALGFNRETVGVAAMGDFEVNPLPADTGEAMVASIARVMAWKLAPYGRNPLTTDQLTSNASGGTSRFKSGQVATVPVIAADSDLAVTTCPGRNLLARMGQIRTIAASLIPSLPKPAPSFGSLSAQTVAYRAPSGVTLSPMTTRPMAWTMTVTSACVNDAVRVLRGRQTYPGPLNALWNLRDSLGVPVTPGVFKVTFTGSAVDGGQYAPLRAVTVRVTAPTGVPAGPCESVTRTTGSSAAAMSVQLGRWSEPSAASAVLVPGTVASDLGYQQVAAPLAHARHLPMFVVQPSAIPDQVLADLTARGVRSVILVGGTDRLTAALVKQLAVRGIGSQRYGGADLATTAVAVAKALNAQGSRGAIYADPVSLPAESALAAAAAARTGRPLLIVGARSIPAATRAFVTQRGITTGAVIAPTTLFSEALRASLHAVRIWSTDPATLAIRLSPTTGGDRAILIPSRSRTEASLAAALGRPLLPVTPTGLVPAVVSWLGERPEVVELAAVASPLQASDVVLTRVARQLIDRAPAPFSLAGVGHRGSSAVVRVTTPPPTPIPANFTINGSGWGHGIGLSQAGAYGQAREGRTAKQIVTHYYTGTAVTPIDDSVILAVALLHRVPVASLRTEQLVAGTGGAVRIKISGGRTVVGTTRDVFRFTYSGGLIVVTRRTSGGPTLVIGRTNFVRVTWEGNRSSGTLGTGATLVNLVGPGDSFRDAQHRYRYGSIDLRTIAATSSSPAGMMVLNNVRLHDEYLYGIAEVEASWPLAALQSQILASRSYAYAQWKAGARKGCLCHSDDGGGPYYDQTFLGWVKTDEGSYSPAWRAAVDSTSVVPFSAPGGVAPPTMGKAITYHGAVITAYYTDSTGGRTQNNEDVWGDPPLAWARSVDDHWSLDPLNSRSFAHWRPRVRDQATMASAFGLPDVVSVSVTKRLASGTARVLTATSSTGVKASISGAAFRRAMDLPSQWVNTVVAGG